LKVEDFRKGMSLIDLNESPIATKIFEAEVWSLDGNKKNIRYKIEPVITMRHIRQTCKIKKEDKKDDYFIITPDDRIYIIFEFKNYPEYVKKNDIILINEHSFKAIGIIINLIK
jgi:GTPase